VAEFFKPWRRKLGVVTLVMACVFVGGWVRSEFIIDLLGITFPHDRHYVFSCRSCIWWKHDNHKASLRPLGWQASSWREFTPGDEFLTSRYLDTEEAFSNDYVSNLRDRVRCIPYSAIVIPLTLLSAFLLLSKPRVAKPKTIAEINPEKVV